MATSIFSPSRMSKSRPEESGEKELERKGGPCHKGMGRACILDAVVRAHRLGMFGRDRLAIVCLFGIGGRGDKFQRLSSVVDV